jgi:hypothetical protein
MPKFKEIRKEGKYSKRSHYVGGLESREPTKEAAYIYAQKCRNYYFLLAYFYFCLLLFPKDSITHYELSKCF